MRDGAPYPDAEAFGGPIRARFEGRTPSSCGHEKAPITTLDLGGRDTEAPTVWGANMAVRRSAFNRIGPFDEAVGVGGDEEDWLLALRRASATSAGGSIRASRASCGCWPAVHGTGSATPVRRA